MMSMNQKEKRSKLIVDRDTVTGSVAVTGSLSDGDDPSLEAAIDAARKADEDLIIILTHGARAEARAEREDVAPVESGRETVEPDASLQAVAAAVAKALGQRQSMLGLIDQLSPATEVLSPPAVLQARRNAAERASFLEQHGGLTAAEVSDLAGSSAHNRSALAARWRKEGLIFAVPHRGVLHYPVFQFGPEGRPLPVIADVLAVFEGQGLSAWEVALWFTTRTGWLGDRRPIDLLVDDSDLVREAARHEIAAIAG